VKVAHSTPFSQEIPDMPGKWGRIIFLAKHQTYSIAFRDSDSLDEALLLKMNYTCL